jgi:hypothetical protein
MTTARADNSRQRHQASENSGQTRAAVTAGIIAVNAHSSGFAAQADRSERPLTSRFVVSCCPLLSPRVRRVAAPARPTQALSGPVGSGFAALLIYSRTCVRYAGPVGTWHDPDVGRPIAAPLERCAELLGLDLATVRELAAKVEPYLRADGTKIWSLMQLERQLRPEAYGRRRGGYLDRRRVPGADA